MHLEDFVPRVDVDLPAATAGKPGLGAIGFYVSSILASGASHADSPALDAPTADTDDQLQQVTVTGVRSLLHGKLPEDEQNTPQSITVVSGQVIADQGDTRLTQALQNVPGITLNAGEGAARGDTVNIRGFSAFNDFFLDGIRDAAVYTRDSFDLESVEVLKGPSALLFGRGSTGGAINQVSKAPLLTPLEVVTADFGTNDLYRATGDFDMPLAAATAARLNVMGETSSVADRDFVKNRRWGVAPAVSFGIGAADSLTLAYLHQQEDNVPDPGIPFVADRVAPVPLDTYYGLTSDRNTSDDDIATLRYKHDFSPDVQLADTMRYAHYVFNYMGDMPNFGDDIPQPGTPLDDILVGRDRPASSGVQTNLTEQLDLNAHFATGILTHIFQAGLELTREESDLDRYDNPFNTNNNWIPETPLLAPDPYEQPPGPLPVSTEQDTLAHSSSLYIADTIGLGEHLNLLAGARYDRFAADYQQLTLAGGSVLDLSHTDRLGSPRAALFFKPTPAQTYYLSYGTSFDPSAEALTLTTRTANLGPVKAKTYEAGSKITTAGGGLLLTAAVFRTEVDNAQTNDPDNPTLTILNGDQRVQGLELGASGHLTRHWELLAGYTYLDGKTLSSGTPADVGQPLPNIARNAVNLWTEYEFSPAWEAGIGGLYQGRRYADSAGTTAIPGFVVWNAMLSYRITPSLALQLNGFNLLNKAYYLAPYYTSAAENHVIPGPGRSATLSVRLAL